MALTIRIGHSGCIRIFDGETGRSEKQYSAWLITRRYPLSGCQLLWKELLHGTIDATIIKLRVLPEPLAALSFYGAKRK